MKKEQLRRLKRVITVALMLLLTIFSFKYPVVRVHADGASTTEEVWVEFKSTWEGQEADEDGNNNIEGDTCASKFNYSTWDFDILNIVDVRAYVANGVGAGTRTYRIGFWNYTADNDGGARFGYIEFTHLESVGYEWKDKTGATAVTVTDNVFFIGAWAENLPDGAGLAYSSDGGTLKSILDTLGFGADPFAETDSKVDRTFNLQFRGWGYKNTSTSHNLYYGSATDFIARRDVNYTFPSGSTNRQIRMTYPADEGIRNITRSNGGAWNVSLSTSDYSTSTLNGTHKLLTIPHATLNSYGGDYRVFTQSHDYVYTLDGAFYENGTNYGAATITAHTPTNSSSVEVDGETTYGSDDEVLLLSWSLSGGGSRRFYTPYQTETLKVFFPEDTYATYEFSVIDYTGKLGEGTSYLEAYRTVNSTEELIERMKIQDTINTVPLSLVVGQTYHLKILWHDETTYDWGYFVAGVDPTPAIVLSKLSFSQQAQMTYRHLSVEATRVNATHIRVNYEDTAPSTYGTDYCNITIYYRNQTKVTSSNSTSETVSYNWYNADNETDYWVHVEIDHGFFTNTIEYWKLLDYDRSYNSFPSFALTGWTFGGINTANLFSLVLVLGVFGGFNRYSADLALIVAFSFAGFLRIVGANTWDYNVIVFGLALSVAFAVYRGRVRI